MDGSLAFALTALVMFGVPVGILLLIPKRLAGASCIFVMVGGAVLSALLWANANSCSGDGCIGIAMIAMIVTAGTAIAVIVAGIRWATVRSTPDRP